MAQVNFEIEFNNDGTATIRLPEGKTQQVNAAKVADLTDKLSKLMGTVKERHIGDHHHEHGEQTHTHDHQQEGH
jgi:hypothetical protein